MTKDKKAPSSLPPEANLVLSETGDVGLTYDRGFFEEEPVCVMFDETRQRLSVILKSGTTIMLAEILADRFLEPLKATRRVLLMEIDQGDVVAGYGLPLLKKTTPVARSAAVA